MGLSVDLEKVFYDNMKKTVLFFFFIEINIVCKKNLECCQKKQLHYQHGR